MLEKSFMPLLTALGWISLMLLLGVVLRAKVKAFQSFLFPACLIGGVIGFVIISVGWCSIDKNIFTLIAFHLFSLGFTSLGLTGGSGRGKAKRVIKGGVWIALLWTTCLSIQSLAGGGLLFGFNAIMDPIYEGLGFLCAHGYSQGPGQTLAIAAVWQDSFNIPGAVSIGLTFSAAGFFIAALVGVPIANWGVRKGLAANAPRDLPEDFLKGIYNKNRNIEAGKQTTHPANIDVFAFQMAVLFGIYFLTYIQCGFLKMIFPDVMKPLTYGYIFLYGLINAMIVRLILNKFGFGYLIDNAVQQRITGSSIDFMIIATMMAINIATIWKYIIPVITISIICAVATFWIVIYFGRRAGELPLERTLAVFGYCTGTAASGLLLLRIVDPDFKTSVAMEIGLMNIFVPFTSVHIIFLHGALPGSPISVAQMLGIHLLTAATMLILMKVFKMWKKPAW